MAYEYEEYLPYICIFLLKYEFLNILIHCASYKAHEALLSNF